MNLTMILIIREFTLNMYRYVKLIYPKCSILDPCNGVTCGTGLKTVAALGVCQCLQVKITLIRHAYKLVSEYKAAVQFLQRLFSYLY